MKKEKILQIITRLQNDIAFYEKNKEIDEEAANKWIAIDEKDLAFWKEELKIYN